MGAHVLVVDDNPSNLKLACDVLESADYRVERAGTADVALALIERAVPELILLDIALPGMDGLTLTRKLKADPLTKHVIVVAMTAFAMKGDDEKARAAGCDGYITKPIDTRLFPQQVSEYLTGGGARIPNRILVVDDLATNRKLLRITLESEAFTVFEASDGLEALKVMESTPIEAVISDILMPNMDGYRLCYEIRSSERWFKLPVIIYTNTYTSPGDEQMALEMGADRYLRKPSPPHIVREALRDAVKSSSGRTRVLIREPEGLDLLKAYSGRLVAKLEDRNTELNHQTQALSESNRLFGELTAHLPQVFWLRSADGKRVYYVSPAYETVYGRSCQSLITQPESWLESVHEQDRSRVEAAVRRSAKGANYREEYRLVRPDGQVAWIEERAFPIRDDTGQVGRLAGLAEDISARKTAEQTKSRLEAELLQAQKLEALGTLAGGIAHDFNNIVTAILGNAELARIRLAADHPGYEHVAQILQASQRAVDLVRQILTFSRKQELVREPIALSAIIIEVVRLLRGSLPANIGIRAALPDSAPMAIANSSQVHQVLMNICSNAAHAMAEHGGVIEVRETHVVLEEETVLASTKLRQGNYLRVDVSDTGHGMDEATLAHIFEPFFTTKSNGRGTGLGLSVVHGIMQDHHGAATVESKVGQGTTLRLFFPVWTGSIARSPRTASVEVGQGERLLVVDDELAVVGLVTKSLEILGYRVSSFTAPREALEAFRACPDDFDLVITDMRMPGMSGLELATQLREVRRDVPILLHTGYMENVENVRLRELGIRSVLNKPFTLEVLSQRVRRALE